MKVRTIFVGLLAALLPVLMAPTGGYPSRPTFQAVTNVGSYSHTVSLNAQDLMVHGTNSSTGTSAGEAFELTNNLGTSMALGQAGGSATSGVPTNLPSGAGYLVSNAATPLCLGTEYAAMFCIDGGGNISTTASVGSVPWSASGAVRYTDSGTNFSGATLPTFGGNPVAQVTTGSGTLTYSSGCTSGSVSPTYVYTLVGKTVTLTMTSAANCPATTDIVMTGLPAAIQPTRTTNMIVLIENATVIAAGEIILQAGTSVTLNPLSTISGTVGVYSGTTMTYELN
jgi:hypothetical protein